MTRFISRSFFQGVLSLVLVALVLSGCSNGVKKVTVNGTISYKGQPLHSGIIQFVGENGSYSAAVVQPDGTFIITDVVPGEVKVGVQEAPGGRGSSDPKAGRGVKASVVSLPAKYRNAKTSELKYTITPDTTQLSINIE